MPRFTIVNNSKRDIELQQPTGFSGDYEKCSLKAGHLRLYHLPDVYSERKLSVQVNSSYQHTLSIHVTITPCQYILFNTLSTTPPSTRSTYLFCQVLGTWSRTAEFPIDEPGAYTLRVKNKVSVASLKHVEVRSHSHYIVEIPPADVLPGGEYGMHLETDMFIKGCIIVKSIKPLSWAAQNTDIQVGDKLLQIKAGASAPWETVTAKGDGFEIAIEKLKAGVRGRGCFAEFMTVEERLRQIRTRDTTKEHHDKYPHKTTTAVTNDKSMSSHQGGGDEGPSLSPRVAPFSPRADKGYYGLSGAKFGGATSAVDGQRPGLGNGADKRTSKTQRNKQSDIDGHTADNVVDGEAFALRVEMKKVEASTFIIINEASQKYLEEYTIQNNSVSHSVFYKQKGIAVPWMELEPGDTRAYVWDDPLKPRDLVRNGLY